MLNIFWVKSVGLVIFAETLNIKIMALVTTFSDGSTLEYGRGQFDDWCVYLKRPNEIKYAPRDYQYFARLKGYAERHGAQTVYNAFVQLYDMTDAKLSQNTIAAIKTITAEFGADALDMAIDFTIMYMGMIAEENKENTMLGKRIKRLGVHQVLLDGFTPNQAANFSRDKRWREISAECNKRGF